MSFLDFGVDAQRGYIRSELGFQWPDDVLENAIAECRKAGDEAARVARIETAEARLREICTLLYCGGNSPRLRDRIFGLFGRQRGRDDWIAAARRAWLKKNGLGW